MNDRRHLEAYASDLERYAKDPTPTWIFNVDAHCMYWGNDPALAFWDVSSLEELCAKDFSQDSQVVKERVREIFEEGGDNKSVQETWTIHPKGVPITAKFSMKPIMIPDGARALLIRFTDRIDLTNDPAGLRLLEASRFIPSMVSTFTTDGEVLAQNSAAMACYSVSDQKPGQTVPLNARFRDRAIAQAILACIARDGVYEADVPMNLPGRKAWHSIVARKARDPITGDNIIVLTEQDVTDRIRLSDELDYLNKDLEQRVEERTQELNQAVAALEAENSERRRIEADLRNNLNLTESLLDAIPSPVFYKDAKGRFINCNDAFAEFVGTTRSNVVGKRMGDLASSEVAELCEAVDCAVRETNDHHAYPFRTSEQAQYTVYKAPFVLEKEPQPGVVGVIHDVTELKQAQWKLEQTAEQLADVTELSSDWFWELDADLKFSMLSRRYQLVMGKDPESLMGKTMEEAFPISVERHPAIWQKYYDAVAERKDIEAFVHPCYGTGRRRTISSTAKAIFDDNGQFKGYRGASTDISEQVSATDALLAREAQLTQAQRLAKLGVVIWNNIDDQAVFWSQGSRKLLGLDCKSSDPLDRSLLYHSILPEDRDAHQDAITKSIMSSGEYDITYRIQHPDGRIANIREVGQSTSDPEAEVSRTVVTVQDTTELDMTAEHLRNAQRTESLRQVASELAHDFNNALSVVRGTLELVGPSQSLDAKQIDTILAACDQGSRLTQRLLAYARQQPLEAKEVNLPEILLGMETLLSSAVGSAIRLDIKNTGSTWPAFADPSQVEDALLNLAINARDAMPEGGTLSITCRNAQFSVDDIPFGWPIEPGRYSVITVTDTGKGMGAEIKNQAFDPFYTTKASGRGSGLGLATVMGFCRQSGGHVTIDSMENKGTTVCLYLPCKKSTSAAAQTDLGDVDGAAPKTVLVVEDDHAVQDVASRLLKSLGYRTVCVDSAAHALKALQTSPAFDLILSDIILQDGQSGLELAEDIWKIDHKQQILFMSGYAPDFKENEIAQRSKLLKKPFSRSELARAVVSAMDA